MKEAEEVKSHGLCVTIMAALMTTGCMNGGAKHERLSAPRIRPVEMGEWTNTQRAHLEPHERAGRLFNVFKTADPGPNETQRVGTHRRHI